MWAWKNEGHRILQKESRVLHSESDATLTYGYNVSVLDLAESLTCNYIIQPPVATDAQRAEAL